MDNSLFEGLMWSQEQFTDYLKFINKSEKINEVNLRIRQIVSETVKSGKDKFGKRINSFGVLGFDFMVDSEFRVWLIEVNASPSMEYSTV